MEGYIISFRVLGLSFILIEHPVVLYLTSVHTGILEWKVDLYILCFACLPSLRHVMWLREVGSVVSSYWQSCDTNTITLLVIMY